MRVRRDISVAIAIAWPVVATGSGFDSCDGIPVSVSAPDPSIAERTCRAAARALPRLAECGVDLTEPVAITIRDAMPGRPDCMGIYHCGEDRIELLSPSAVAQARRDDGAFHAVPDGPYFDSILAHELAHAAYDAVPCPYPNCLVTSEYVAYSMQVHAMPRAERVSFEADIPLADRVSRYEITTTVLLMAPDRFARKVWAHFSQRIDGCAYVADMMRGNFYLDVERP